MRLFCKYWPTIIRVAINVVNAAGVNPDREPEQQKDKPLANSITTPFRYLNHPVHIVLLVSTLPLFLGAFLSDWAYFESHQIQWINFASWLIAGALVFLGLAMLWAVIDLLRADGPRWREKWIYIALIAMIFILGLVNALVHAKDGWAIMPEGLILSAIVLFMTLAVVWVGFAGSRTRAPK